MSSPLVFDRTRGHKEKQHTADDTGHATPSENGWSSPSTVGSWGGRDSEHRGADHGK
jgi:hypothetical protein